MAVSSFEDFRDFPRVDAAASGLDHRRDHRAHHVAEKTVCLDSIDEHVAGAGPFTREHAAHGGLYARAERAERGEVMIADKDLNIDRSENSAPWLVDMFKVAAKNTGHSADIYKYSEAEEDDHLPFAQRGVPVLDVIDAHYGPVTQSTPDGYHHTAEDTLDKISAKSLQISGDLFLEMIRLINQRP